MASTNRSGRCCSDNLCVNDSLSLNPPPCRSMQKKLHMIFAQINNVTDRTECLKCVGMNEAMAMPVELVMGPIRKQPVKNKAPSMVQTRARQVRRNSRARAATNVTKVTKDKNSAKAKAKKGWNKTSYA